METSGVRRLKELEAENARLRRIVAQQAMDNDAFKELLRGKWSA
jgi:putative transposase